MRDTPSELREVVDRSMEATWNANNLPSTTSVFSHVVGSMDDDAPVMVTFYLVDDEDSIPIDDDMPIMEKMFIVHQDDDITPCLHEEAHVGHMEPSTTTSTSPTSHERDFKDNKGDDATMIPLVDMMTC